MHIMTPEIISTAYYINLYHQPMCLYVYPLLLLGNGSMKTPLSWLGNGSVKRYRGNEYTRNSRRIVGLIVFYAVRIVSRKVGD
jgi:hypothetical protein